MSGITVVFHPRPGAAWPAGEPETVRAAYDLTRTAYAGPEAAEQAIGIAVAGPGAEAEAGLEIEP